MKQIQMLTEQIAEEIGDAKKYAAMAVNLKESDPDLAKMYFSLSQQELEHMQILHRAVTEMIQRFRDVSGEPPAEMLAVYNYLHDRQIRNATEVKNLQSLYREN